MNVTDLHVGQRVRKIGGDYDFEGYVVAKFTKHNAPTVHRCVVENDDRVLHIYSPHNLDPVDVADTPDPEPIS